MAVDCLADVVDDAIKSGSVLISLADAQLTEAFNTTIEEMKANGKLKPWDYTIYKGE